MKPLYALLLAIGLLQSAYAQSRKVTIIRSVKVSDFCPELADDYTVCIQDAIDTVTIFGHVDGIVNFDLDRIYPTKKVSGYWTSPDQPPYVFPKGSTCQGKPCKALPASKGVNFPFILKIYRGLVLNGFGSKLDFGFDIKDLGMSKCTIGMLQMPDRPEADDLDDPLGPFILDNLQFENICLALKQSDFIGEIRNNPWAQTKPPLTNPPHETYLCSAFGGDAFSISDKPCPKIAPSTVFPLTITTWDGSPETPKAHWKEEPRDRNLTPALLQEIYILASGRYCGRVIHWDKEGGYFAWTYSVNFQDTSLGIWETQAQAEKAVEEACKPYTLITGGDECVGATDFDACENKYHSEAHSADGNTDFNPYTTEADSGTKHLWFLGPNIVTATEQSMQIPEGEEMTVCSTIPDGHLIRITCYWIPKKAVKP
jgi:hypothetical protein